MDHYSFELANHKILWLRERTLIQDLVVAVSLGDRSCRKPRLLLKVPVNRGLPFLAQRAAVVERPPLPLPTPAAKPFPHLPVIVPSRPRVARPLNAVSYGPLIDMLSSGLLALFLIGAK